MEDSESDQKYYSQNSQSEIEGEDLDKYFNQPSPLTTSTQLENGHSLPESSETQFDENGDVVVTWNIPRVSENIDESEFHSLVENQQDLPSPSTIISRF